MNLFACNFEVGTKAVPDDLAGKLCDRTAAALGARLVSREQIDAAIEGGRPEAGDSLLHVLEASIISPNAIAMDYAFGTVSEWRDRRQNRFDDLQLDMTDAAINDAALTQIADMLRRLSAR